MDESWSPDIILNGVNEFSHPIGDRAQVICEIEGLIAHIFKLDKKELEHILTTFPLVQERMPWIIKGTLKEYDRIGSLLPK